MDSSHAPRIRIQRSVSVTLGTTRPGSSSSSHHHYHHLHSGGRPRTSSSASMSSALAEGSSKMGRQRSLSHGKPSRPLMDNDIYGRDTVAVTTGSTATATAPRRTESAVRPSPGGPVLPRPKAHDARVRMIVKQHREVQEIRDLADFLRNRTPPPGNFMSRPDDAASARSASPDPPKSRSQLARRWCTLKSVFALRRRKAHKDEQKRRSRRASAETAAATATATATATTAPAIATAVVHPLPKRPKTAQLQLPDSAVAGTTIAGHRHIAISIPIQHAHLGPEPRSQYPVYAPGEDCSAGLFSPPHAAAELDAGQGRQHAIPWLGERGALTVLRPVAEARESGGGAPRSPAHHTHTPMGILSVSPAAIDTTTTTAATTNPHAQAPVVRNRTSPTNLRGALGTAPAATTSSELPQPSAEEQQHGRVGAWESLVPSESAATEPYFTAPDSPRLAPEAPSEVGTFGRGRSGVRSSPGDRSACTSIDGRPYSSGSEEGGREYAACSTSALPRRSNTTNTATNKNKDDARRHHRRRSSMTSRKSIADSIMTDGTEPVIMTDCQRVRRISSSPSIVHRYLSGIPRHSLPLGLAFPSLPWHARHGHGRGDGVPVTSSGGGSGGSQRRLRRVSRDIRNPTPTGDDPAVPGTPTSQRTIRPQRQAEDNLDAGALQGLDRSPLTPFPTETGPVEQAEVGGQGEGSPSSSHASGDAFSFSSSETRVSLTAVMAVSATELTTPPRSRGSMAASTPGVVTPQQDFQLQPAPRFARSSSGGGFTTASPGLAQQSSPSPTCRTKPFALAARRLVVGGGSPSAVQQRHLLAPSWPLRDQPLPPTPSSGPTPPDSPKPSEVAVVATETAAAMKEEPVEFAPPFVKQHHRRHSTPVSEAAKSSQGSVRHASAQHQQQQEPAQPAPKEPQGHTITPEQATDRVSLSRRIERRKKFAAAAAGARQAEVFAAVAAAQARQKKRAEEATQQQPRSMSPSISSHSRHPSSATAPAPAPVVMTRRTLTTPAERRVEEMEKRVRLLEQTGEAWLGALVPLMENLGRTLETQREHEHIEEYRRRRRQRRMSSGSEAAPHDGVPQRSGRPRTSGYESYTRRGGGSRRWVDDGDDGGDEFPIRDRNTAAPLHPNLPISRCYDLSPSPAGDAAAAAAQALRPSQAPARMRSTASTAGSRKTAVLIGDLADEVSRQPGPDNDGRPDSRHRQRQRQHQHQHRGSPSSRLSSHTPPPPSMPLFEQRSATRHTTSDEATARRPLSSHRRQQQQRPQTAHNSHRRHVSSTSARSAAASFGFEHGSSSTTRSTVSSRASSSNWASEPQHDDDDDEASISMDGFHTLSPLMHELTGHGLGLEFYPKEPVRIEDEYEGDIAPYY